MARRRVRLGVRAQLTLIVLFGAVLSTAATLFIANNAIQNYALQQAQNQERDNLKIAQLVLTTQYGQNISISSDNKLVADSPTTGHDFNVGAATNFGKYQLNGDTDYVDSVKQLIGGIVSVYQCANAKGAVIPCTRVATTLQKMGSTSTSLSERDVNAPLDAQIAQHMALSATPREWLGEQALNSTQYYVEYAPLYGPQQNFIGVLSVGVPLDTVTSLQRSTTIELLLLGVIIMIAGIILALLFASAIISTLQRVARQVSDASEQIGSSASQQAGGSAQQVWAVNAINKALQGFSDMAKDIAQRTDQLALMGNQVIQRRAEIAPAQIDSILAYMTRSVRDISNSSRQQASQYERMTGAMQAVIEIAEQVAANSQHSTASAERLEQVVRQLQELVGVQRLSLRPRGESTTMDEMPALGSGNSMTPNQMPGMAQPTVRAVRPGGPMMPVGQPVGARPARGMTSANDMTAAGYPQMMGPGNGDPWGAKMPNGAMPVGGEAAQAPMGRMPAEAWGDGAAERWQGMAQARQGRASVPQFGRQNADEQGRPWGR